eukprot:4336475-Prymnesium_polylepis.1
MGRVARALARRLPQAADARARHAQPPGPHHAGRPLLRRLHRAALVRVWVRHPQPAPRPSDRVLGVGARPIHLLLLALRLARHAASRRRQPVAARAAGGLRRDSNDRAPLLARGLPDCLMAWLPDCLMA